MNVLADEGDEGGGMVGGLNFSDSKKIVIFSYSCSIHDTE
jgi:hypothetical protein